MRMTLDRTEVVDAAGGKFPGPVNPAYFMCAEVELRAEIAGGLHDSFRVLHRIRNFGRTSARGKLWGESSSSSRARYHIREQL